MNRSKTKPDSNSARRTFIKQAGMGAAAAMGLPAVLSSCTGTDVKSGNIDEYFSDGDVILFQGDSITDAGRNKQQHRQNNQQDHWKKFFLHDHPLEI